MKLMFLLSFVLILMNSIAYFYHTKIHRLHSKEFYTVKNYIQQVSRLKSFIDCNKTIFLYMALPAKVDKIFFDSYTLTRYALSPCEIIFKGEQEIVIEKGIFIINSLHKDFESNKTKYRLVKDDKDIAVFEIE